MKRYRRQAATVGTGSTFRTGHVPWLLVSIEAIGFMSHCAVMGHEGLHRTTSARRVDWARIGWSADPDALRSGIDESPLDVLPGELERIVAWV